MTRALIFTLMIFAFVSVTRAQTPEAKATDAQEQPEPPAMPGQVREVPKSPEELKLEREREKALNKERQEDLKRDTDKLLQLATELKQYVDQSNENMLSLNVIRKAEQIEKLAKSVQKKMVGP